MTRYATLALVVLALGISTSAQTSASSQSSSNTSVGVQTNGPAGAAASASQQGSQSTSVSKQGPGSSKSASASAAGNSSSAASASVSGNSLGITSGTPIQAALVTPVDAKHSKPGDPVVAKTTQDVKQDGQTVLKKGSRLTGHVTQAQARSGASAESSVGMVFDSAVAKDGQHVPMNMSVQALAAAANQTSADLANDQGAINSTSQTGMGFTGAGSAPGGGGIARGGVGGGGSAIGGVGGAVGGTVRNVSSVAGGATSSVGTVGSVAGNAGQGVNGTVGGVTRTTGSAAGNVGGLNAAGQLMSGSSGVFNLQGLNLTSAATNSTQGSASIVSSTSRNVHLDSGTQMLLQVVSQ